MKNKKATMDTMVPLIIGVVVAMIMFSVIWGMQTSSTTLDVITDTADIAQNVPFNITLSGYDPATLINVTNGTGNMDTGNYTDWVTSGFLQIDDNTSYTGTVSVQYNDAHVGYMTGIPALIVGFIAVMFLIGVILYIKNRWDSV